MNPERQELLRDAARRGKYAPLHDFLRAHAQREWRTTFREIEGILGFRLPNSARIHRPWWANQGQGGGHSHALAWEMAGWRTAEVDLSGETLVFRRE